MFVTSPPKTRRRMVFFMWQKPLASPIYVWWSPQVCAAGQWSLGDSLWLGGRHWVAMPAHALDHGCLIMYGIHRIPLSWQDNIQFRLSDSGSWRKGTVLYTQIFQEDGGSNESKHPPISWFGRWYRWVVERSIEFEVRFQYPEEIKRLQPAALLTPIHPLPVKGLLWLFWMVRPNMHYELSQNDAGWFLLHRCLCLYI